MLTLPLYEPGGFPVSNTFAWGYDFTRSYGFGPVKGIGAETGFIFL